MKIIEQPLPIAQFGKGQQMTEKVALLGNLKVGQALVLDPVEFKKINLWSAGKRFGCKFAGRKLPDGTCGIWRVS